METGDVSCPSCHLSIPSGRLICAYCGTPRRALISREEQKQGLEELHHALASAMKRVERDRGAAESPEEEDARARILRNAFLPDDADLLFTDAQRCAELLDATSSAIVKSRFDACLLRLESLAVNDPAAKTNLEILRRREADRERKVRTSDRQAFLGCTVFLLLLAGAGWLIVYSCRP